MVRRYSIILSFVLATLLAAGGVELFYRSLTQALTGNKEVTGPAITGHTAGVTKDVNGDSSPPSLLRKRGGNENKDDYTIITKRNLFGKVKEKIIAKPVETKPVLTATSLNLVLLGTINGTLNDQRAIIRNKKNNSQEIYYTGDAIEHALIKEIGRGQIILTVNGKDEILLMEESKSPKGSANKNSNTSEIYSLADAMEKEASSKPPSRKRKPPRKTKTLQLENKLR